MIIEITTVAYLSRSIRITAYSGTRSYSRVFDVNSNINHETMADSLIVQMGLSGMRAEIVQVTPHRRGYVWTYRVFQ